MCLRKRFSQDSFPNVVRRTISMTTEDDYAVNRSAQNRRCKCGDEQSVRLHGARYTLGGKSQAAKV